MASSIRCTSLAFARIALSFTARRSTWVISDGTPMTTRGRSQPLRLCALRMKCVSIFSAASKSAMTPSFIGRIAVMVPGVRPSISLASVPTASIRQGCLFAPERNQRIDSCRAPGGHEAGGQRQHG